jgi:hypothetical protein
MSGRADLPAPFRQALAEQLHVFERGFGQFAVALRHPLDKAGDAGIAAFQRFGHAGLGDA